MALKDLLALADDKLHDLFERKPHDPTKARAAFVKRIDTNKNHLASATPTKGRKMFRIANGVARIELPFSISGKSVFHVPSERAADWFDHLKDSVSRGELDKELEAGDTAPAAGSTSTRKKREMTPEATAAMVAKRRATLEAKKKNA